MRLVITGAAGGVWTAVHRGGRWGLDADQLAPATTSVTMDQDIAWRLFTKGVRPDEVRGRVLLDGDAALADAVLRMVSILA